MWRDGVAAMSSLAYLLWRQYDVSNPGVAGGFLRTTAHHVAMTAVAARRHLMWQWRRHSFIMTRRRLTVRGD